MTADRKLKRAIRARMERTGENYTTARRALLEEAALGAPLQQSSIDDVARWFDVPLDLLTRPTDDDVDQPENKSTTSQQ